jgi:hypothetical protein
MLFGSILVLDLRLLGWRRGVPLGSIATLTVPLAAAGFVVAALSGVCLLATHATDYDGNPFLLIKFPAVALGLVNAIAIGRLHAWRARNDVDCAPRERVLLRTLGGVSLLSWSTALGAGRMIGYW